MHVPKLNTTALRRSGLRAAGVLLLAGLLAAAPPGASGQDLQQEDDFNKGGRTAFQFVKIGVGARQAALGEASVAVVRDVSAVFWNPASIIGIERFEAAFSYTRWLADMNYVAGAVGTHWQGVGSFAFSIASLDYGAIEEALVSSTTGGDTRTGNTFSGSDLLVGLSFSRSFTDRLAIGIGAKILREDLFDYSVSTLAFDVGTTYDLGYKGIRLAMAAQNFAGSVRWLGDESDRQEGYDIPLVFRIGVATNLVGDNAFVDAGPSHAVVLSVEAINTNDFSERVHLGAEYAFGGFLTLRGGYRFNYEEGNWAAGVGLNPRFADLRVQLDYAYVAYEFLNAPHRFTLLVGL